MKSTSPEKTINLQDNNYNAPSSKVFKNSQMYAAKEKKIGHRQKKQRTNEGTGPSDYESKKTEKPVVKDQW